MFCTKLKKILNNSIHNVCADINSFVYHPGKDFSRVRSLPADLVISYLISQGGSSTLYLHIVVNHTHRSGHFDWNHHYLPKCH